MSFGMGVMDNNLVHRESSKLKSSLSLNVSDEKRRVLDNHKIDLMTGIKFKRRKVFAVRDFPPGCGSPAMMMRTRSDVKTMENGNVVAEEEDDKVESSSSALGKGNGEQNDVESVPEPVVTEKKKEELIVSAPEVKENGGDASMVEVVEVEPLSICLPDDVVRDFPPETGSKMKDSLEDSSGSRGSDVSSSGTENMVRDIVVYADENSDYTQSEVLEVENLSVRVPKPIHVAGRRKAKKGVAFHSALKRSRKMKREYGESSRMRNNERDLYLRERESSDVEDYPDQRVVTQRSRVLNVGIPPSRPIGSSGNEGIRYKVKETLRLFYGACRKILQEEEAKPQRTKRLRVDYEASKILKRKGKYLNEGVQIMGPVPGIEVGDEFQYRMELNVLGIHRPSQGGIDYMKVGEDIVATCIVASGGYDDELDNSDTLIYTGQGGNVMKGKKKRGEEEREPEDQKLVTGNLALANSATKKNPVRVIRGKSKGTLESSSREGKGGGYVYDGLYLVEEFWQATGSHGKLVYKYKLRRMPGQPELSWKVVKKSTKLKYREGLCKLDISEGKERLPISAINEIDDEKPPQFSYTVKMIYPDWCRPVPPKACSCTKRCTEASNCSCVAKNGGEIPYNYDGAVVSAKTLIYECGPHCKCSANCYLRVTQRGIKFQLEIFKTESRGWGVRSLNSIPSGSFICEYIGELVEDEEAERRTGNDEYLFDIGNKYDNSLAEGMSELMPGTQAGPTIEETSGFTIDAAAKGNVGRFINHSCSPNLYAQNVLYDHGDTRMPHVMFFAMDNIPPLQELSYHYNYMIDQVRDANGNIKKKICYCGSSDCTGRLY